MQLWARQLSSVQFSPVTQSRPTLCDPMNHSTPGLPVHYQFPESTQIHVHWVSDAIQPSHSLLSPSPPAFNLSQNQGLFQWVSSSHQVAKVSASTSVLPMNTQDWTPLGWTGWISLQSKGLSSVLFWHLFFLLFFVMLKAATGIFQCASKSIKKIYFPKLSYQKKS